MPSWLPRIDSSVVLDGLKSLLLLCLLLIFRTLLVRWISKDAALSMEAKRRWVVTVRNSMLFAFLVGLVVIWAHELQAFAVSIVALAAALVLATKELILCWSGAALRVGGKVYSVGDAFRSPAIVAWSWTTMCSPPSCLKSGRASRPISIPAVLPFFLIACCSPIRW
jgi:hypothetical protein